MNQLTETHAIPRARLEALHAEAGAAITLALAGEPENGLGVILEGLNEAQAEYAREPWGSDLVACYCRAAQAFCRRYQVEAPPLRG